MEDLGTGIVVYAVAAVVTVILARWLFSKRGADALSTHPNASLPSNPDERIQALQEMFPHLSAISIRDALERANFIVDDAVSFLLAHNPPVNIVQQPKAPAKPPTRDIVGIVVDGNVDPSSLNQWTEDPQERQRLLALKKRLLVEAARKRIQR